MLRGPEVLLWSDNHKPEHQLDASVVANIGTVYALVPTIYLLCVRYHVSNITFYVPHSGNTYCTRCNVIGFVHYISHMIYTYKHMICNMLMMNSILSSFTHWCIFRT